MVYNMSLQCFALYLCNVLLKTLYLNLSCHGVDVSAENACSQLTLLFKQDTFISYVKLLYVQFTVRVETCQF
jgi:hypothetical protein